VDDFFPGMRFFFFVLVPIRNHLELKDKPVAICHSGNLSVIVEISSANYAAHGYGWFPDIITPSVWIWFLFFVR